MSGVGHSPKPRGESAKPAFDFVATFECGDTFGTYDHDGIRPPQVGDYYSCSHSLPVAYDPETGEPRKWERKHRVVAVEHSPKGIE